MTTPIKQHIYYPLEKHIKKIFTINYSEYKYYQPNVIEVLQSRIQEIDINKHTHTTKLNIIYSTLLDHLSAIFYNSAIFLSNLSSRSLTTSVRKFIYLDNMDMFIIKNLNTKDNKYIPILKKQAKLNAQQIHIYSILCNKFKINISDIPNVLQSISFTLTDNKKNIVFYRVDGAYSVFQKILLNKTPSTLTHIVFKIFAYDSFCSLIYSVEHKTIQFLYSDYEESSRSFSDRVLFALSTSLFKINLQYTSLNLKNIDDSQFEEQYIFIKDIKIWLCIFLLQLAPSINTLDILEYINILPYQLRDILYLNMILFIFEQSKHMKGRLLEYSQLIQELIDEETVHITGIPIEIPSKKQIGGSQESLFSKQKKNTNQLIRNLFFIQ